ncbi:MAG: hypothetical protein PHQ46_07910 [Negativicutes bacterium]|nr:hypothetical protein [Negativicutes bacterium]
MNNVTYQELVAFYGQKVALALLHILEAASREENNVVFIDREKRLQRALESLSDISMAA